MKSAKLSPVPGGTRWPSGESIDLAVIPMTEDTLATRVGLPLSRGIEVGLGSWAGVGGRLPCGTDVEFICYAHDPESVILRTDKNAPHSATLDEALQVIGLSRADVRVSPIVDCR